VYSQAVVEALRRRLLNSLLSIASVCPISCLAASCIRIVYRRLLSISIPSLACCRLHELSGLDISDILSGTRGTYHAHQRAQSTRVSASHHLPISIRPERPPETKRTYTSHLRLEHELDDGACGSVNGVLLSTLGGSSRLVKELDVSDYPNKGKILSREGDIPWQLPTWPFRRAICQLFLLEDTLRI
jgi:hypothetical protein